MAKISANNKNPGIIEQWQKVNTHTQTHRGGESSNINHDNKEMMTHQNQIQESPTEGKGSNIWLIVFEY